jgi:hypothetical protein
VGSVEFEQAIEKSHRSLDQIAKGDPSGYFELYNERGDATLANPFGPPRNGGDPRGKRRSDASRPPAAGPVCGIYVS